MKRNLFILLLCVPFVSSAQTLWSTTVNSSNARFNLSGNVGIGTASGVLPSDKLHVIGNTRADKFVSVLGEFNSISTDIIFKTGSTQRLAILSSNGNIGMGIGNPQEQLHLNGNIRGSQLGALRISSGTGTVDIGAKSGDYGNIDTDRSAFRFNKKFILDDGTIGSFSGNMSLQVAGYNAMTILAGSGNVGIGTTLSSNPNGYKLAVNGKIGAKEVQVETTSWPDYVFKSDYKLITLNEVENFIEKNGHLPEVPSAKQVEADGIKLGEMDAVLLKKIEEVTLYLIQLKKENEELKKRLEVLEKK